MKEYNDYMVELLETLKAERKAQGVTQMEIAERTGIKAPNIALMETGKRSPSLKALNRYANALGKELRIVVEDADK